MKMKTEAKTSTVDVPSDFNTSQTIRYLTASGMGRGDIVRWFMDNRGRSIRYQHVRNVQITPLTGKKD